MLHNVLCNHRNVLPLRILGCEDCFIFIVTMAVSYSKTIQYLICLNQFKVLSKKIMLCLLLNHVRAEKIVSL